MKNTGSGLADDLLVKMYLREYGKAGIDLREPDRLRQ